MTRRMEFWRGTGGVKGGTLRLALDIRPRPYERRLLRRESRRQMRRSTFLVVAVLSLAIFGCGGAQYKARPDGYGQTNDTGGGCLKLYHIYTGSFMGHIRWEPRETEMTLYLDGRGGVVSVQKGQYHGAIRTKRMNFDSECVSILFQEDQWAPAK